MRIPRTHRARYVARLLGLAGITTIALALSAAQAQTCAGALWLEFYDVDYEDSPSGRYVIPLRSLDLTAEYFHGETTGLPTADEARRDPALELRGRDVLNGHSRLYAAGTEVAVAPRCTLALLHLEIEYRRETMTLDVYRVPDHIGLRLDGPIPFRPGRYVLDFETAGRIANPWQEHVYAADAIRPADAPTPGRD